jgi:CheY-like chemotaxis protein/anti-sigma regulatory factor (Ser/Thr protein kinase)
MYCHFSMAIGSTGSEMILFDETISAELGALGDARNRIRRALEDLRFSADVNDAVELCIAEASTNSVLHGRPKPENMRIKLLANSRGIEVLIADDGGAYLDFDEAYAKAAIMPDVLSEGGRGLAIVREAMDKVHYWSADGWNTLTLFRRFARTKLKVLIVEDSDATLALFEAVLAGKFEISTARSLQEFKQMLIGDFDLIIADIHLSDGKSSDFLAALERSGEGLDVPLILVTSDTSEQVIQDAVRLGIETVLAKPVRPKALLAAIDKTVAARSRQRLIEARHFNKILEGIVGRPDFSTLEDYTLAYRMGTAASGGGDLLLDLGGTTRRRLVLADLMGHGTDALARSATWVGMFRGIQSGLADSEPADFVNGFSAALFHANLPEHVIGTFLVIDLLPFGCVEIASGGHPSPLIFSGAEVMEIPVAGALPGLSDLSLATTMRFTLGKGQRLFAATDGVDPDGLAYRIDIPASVLQAAIDCVDVAVETTIEAMAGALDKLTGYRPDDDWTMLLIEAGAFHPA